MAVATPFISSVWQFFDDNGDPAAGYQLFFYETGTSTKKTTYADAAQVASNANPVVLDSAGRADIFLNGTYDIVFTSDTDTDPPASPIWTATAITDLSSLATALRTDLADGTNGAGNGFNLVAIPQTDYEASAGITPTDYHYPPGYPERYGCVGDRVTDDTSNMQDCFYAVGNNVPVVLGLDGHSYNITDQLEIPDGGFRLTGNISNSYFVDSSRSRYHLICGIGAAPTKTLLNISSAKVAKGTVVIEHLNIDMADSTATAIQTEEVASAGGPRATIRNVTIDDCGGDGIVINSGCNTSEVVRCFVDGPSGFLDGGGEFVPGVYVTDSAGIKILCADCRVTQCEVKGGFWYGLYITSTESVVMGNFFDQCKYGGIIKNGSHSRLIGNRFNLNITAGLVVDGGLALVMGNTFQHSSSSRLHTTGSFDGSAVILTSARHAQFIGNKIVQALDGFTWTNVHDTIFSGNTYYDIDGTFHETSGNTPGGTNTAYIFDNITGAAFVVNADIQAQLTADANGHHFGNIVSFDGGGSLKLNTIALTANSTIDPGDGLYLRVTPDTSGWTLDLSANYNATKYIGCPIVVQNDGSDTFTFEGTLIPVGGVCLFIISNSQAGTPVSNTYSTGETGGASSAGAGNQYVQLTIGDTTYKVLHDGTV